MADESEKIISCSEHGEQRPAYVCAHLQNNPSQDWFSNLQSRDDLFPDAWCAACEEVFQKRGVWDDESEEQPDIAVVCENCYENMRAESVARWSENMPDEWVSFVSLCSKNLSAKQETLRDNFRINDHKRWDWDLTEEKLLFSNDGEVAVTAKIEFAGSVSTNSNTWLWGWANPSLTGMTDTVSIKLPRYGQKSKYLKLTTPYWSGDEIDGWEMTAIAVELLGCKGAYRTTSDSSYTYLLIHEISWVS